MESTLVDMFARRTEAPDGRPWAAMAYHVAHLREAVRSPAVPVNLQRCLEVRGIVSLSFDPDVSGDGYIQPNGRTYGDGFRLVLKKGAPAARSRFTMAHEICHTFFYEVVPEIKFAPHQPDGAEERLCNFGAAELLMPAPDVRSRASGTCPSLVMLDRMAEYYGVSCEAVFIRLRALRLWGGALSFWYRRTNGLFALERIYGDRVDWRWPDDLPLSEAWSSGATAPVRGEIFLTRPSATSVGWATCVHFQARRVGNAVAVLWNSSPLGRLTDQLDLFGRPGGRRNKAHRKR